VEFVFRELMGSDVKIRFRPHYFSYTEPSYEIDFTNALVKKMGKDWLEIAGCGMVHPQVFENVGYDPEVWTGWAFGFGIERIAMLRYGINDIRLFYENDVRFLFLGSGTSVVVAKKLGRNYLGIELNEAYACWAAKRVGLAEFDKNIQGYSGGVFWERNTLNMQTREEKMDLSLQPALFERPTPCKVHAKHKK
jgi:hypothetical protein